MQKVKKTLAWGIKEFNGDILPFSSNTAITLLMRGFSRKEIIRVEIKEHKPKVKK